MDVGLTPDGRARLLRDGHALPLLGLGVWQIRSGRETENAVRWALELGYRHIDTAQAYGNEESVGKALHDSGIAREDVFVATKFYPGSRDPEAEMEQSLRRLGLDQVDLYLIHWPRGGPTWAWPGMERAHERGLARSIGVSNFDADELGAVLQQARVPPAVDQVQFSPFKYRRELLEECRHEMWCSRRTARLRPEPTFATGVWRRSPSATTAHRHRCCCGGQCNAAFR